MKFDQWEITLCAVRYTDDGEVFEPVEGLDDGWREEEDCVRECWTLYGRTEGIAFALGEWREIADAVDAMNRIDGTDHKPRACERCGGLGGLPRASSVSVRHVDCPACHGSGFETRQYWARTAPECIVTVHGGVADVFKGSADIVDYDNLNAGDGTGDDDCPCRIGPHLCEVCEKAEKS